jgi:hypothetical protein
MNKESKERRNSSKPRLIIKRHKGEVQAEEVLYRLIKLYIEEKNKE